MEPPPVPASAAAASPERLFDSHRLPSDVPLLVALLLYAPVGLCLLLVRLFVGLHVFLVSCALPDGAPRRFLVRAMCSVLGLFVWQSRPRSARARVLVANHVTPFDHNVLGLLASCSAPVLNGAAGFVCWSRGFLEVAGAESRAELLESLKGYCSQGGNPPLLLFPEEATTNGRVGLLRFSSWPFSIVGAVQPLALRVWRPFVAVSVAGASWVTELLWTFFVPVTVYQVRWLPSVYRQAEETQEEFALRVQELLALELGVVSTCLTAADKAEHLKRLRHHPPASRPPTHPSQPSGVQPQVSRSMASTDDVHLIGMAQRVQEVLPQVPMAAIRKDLAQTNCVDTTIANLLEGRVPFVPEAETEGFVAAAPSFYGAQDPSTSRMAPVLEFKSRRLPVLSAGSMLGRFLKGPLFSLGVREGLCQVCRSQAALSPGTKASALGLRQEEIHREIRSSPRGGELLTSTPLSLNLWRSLTMIFVGITAVLE